MSDYDFLWEMRDLGYSSEEIIEAAACGYAPYEAIYLEPYEAIYLDDDDGNTKIIDNLFDDIKDWDTNVQVSYETIEDEETAYFKEQIFNSLIENAKEYYSLTGRYLQIWGELGELYAELEYGLKRHKDVNHEGSDGFINGKLVEVKTISPLKQHNQVVVKKKGSFEQLLIVRISKNFEFKAKLISRDKLNGTTGKFLKGKIK